MMAYRVTLWRCATDDDVYWTRPQDAPVRLADLINTHRLMQHHGSHPPGHRWEWTVYVNLRKVVEA